MDDEFKLCWKNFQDNIASGFQSLYDRGDLVDVTLAIDGKLLHAHKIVLAICSPYFQEIFITNPCKHPIIILKDVTFNIMCELLEFMYQGVVNVKHTELQSFMKIGQLLQIKGLATNSSSSAASTASEKSSNHHHQIHNADDVAANATISSGDAVNNINAKMENDSANANDDNVGVDGNGGDGVGSGIGAGKSTTSGGTTTTTVTRTLSPASSPSPMAFVSSAAAAAVVNFKNTADSSLTLHHSYHGNSGSGSGSGGGLKRHHHIDFNSDALSIYSRKQLRRSLPSAIDHGGSEHGGDGGESGMDPVNPEDFFLPHISMVESRYDMTAGSVKREGAEHHGSAPSLRNTFGPAFGFDYNLYKNGSGASNSGEYPNDLHMPSDYSKNFGNHMDIPPIAPGDHWFQGKLEFMLSQRGKPLLVHDGHTFGIQYVRKDKKYWQCNLSRKFNCKARVTTTDTGEIIVTNNEHCHTEIRQHLRKDYQRNKVMLNALMNLSTNRLAENMRRQQTAAVAAAAAVNSLSFPIIPQTNINAAIGAGSGANSDSGSEQSALDLGKSSSNPSSIDNSRSRLFFKEIANESNSGTEKQQNVDRPLNCAISGDYDELTRKSSINISSSNNNNNKTEEPINFSDAGEWKCKSEMLDAI